MADAPSSKRPVGRPRTRPVVERRPTAGRPPTGRVKLGIAVAPDVATLLRAAPEGPSAMVERLVRASARPELERG